MRFRKEKASGRDQDQISRRHRVLEYIRNNVMLSDDQMNVSFPESALEFIQGGTKREVSLLLPIKYSRPIKYSLPLAQVSLILIK